MAKTLIKGRNLSLGHAKAARLQNVSVDVQAGELLALIGPNGAGKSSLLAVLAGDEQPSSGDLVFPAWPGAHSATWLARHRAVLPQRASLNFPFPVQQVVRLGRTPHASGQQRDEQIIVELLHALDIARMANIPYTQLSGGEQQRVQLARVLAQIWQAEDSEAPRVLMLDEPTAALDMAHQKQLMLLLRQLCDQGVAVVVVLHDLNLAAAWADRMLCLHQGCLAYDGTPQQVLTQAHIREVFSCECLVDAHPQTGKPVVLHAF
ncbi:MAG: heme ABC transporter ATP-binding protein [Oceanococcus sp.]